MNSNHNHHHAPNRFAVIPTNVRLSADPRYSGKGVTIAFLDSGFYPHPDLIHPANRILAYEDLAGEHKDLYSIDEPQSWQWHGTQTSVAAAGNGSLCDGVYRGLACESELVLVKASEKGRITEESIAAGIKWVIQNSERYNIRVLNISLGADQDVPCSESLIDQAAEEAIKKGIVVVAAAGNSGADGRHSIPPANSPSVITVGGYTDNNSLGGNSLGLYSSNFGATADGTIKPEIVAPAMWVAAPILPGTSDYERAEALSLLGGARDYELPQLAPPLARQAQLGEQFTFAQPNELRAFVESILREHRIVATHYQHVDGTSFAAPIVSSIVAQMLEANPKLTPAAVKSILISTADRIVDAPVIRQGYGVVNARRSVQLALQEQHLHADSGGTPPRVANGQMVFVYHDDSAISVSLVGEFNNWSEAAAPLSKNDKGLWFIELPAPGAGRYEYKFVVDGRRWIEDPSNWMKVQNGFGSLNSVLVVK